LAKAEENVAQCETKIKALTQQIVSLGGNPPTEQELEKLGL